MPLIRLALTVRRHPRAWRLLAGVAVMGMLFAMLLSAVEPAHGRGVHCPVGAATSDRPPLHRAMPARSARTTIAAKPAASSSLPTASA